MQWLIWLSLAFSFLAVSASVYSLLQLSKKLERSDIKDALDESSESTLRTMTARIKAIETEWDNMYDKFASLAGRMDRKKALAPPPPTAEPTSPRSRSDLLRMRRKNVEAGLS